MKDTTITTIFRDYLLVLILFLGIYGYTCAPGPLWQDSGMSQYRIWNNDIEGRLGLALSHPLYYLTGMVFKHLPLGEFARRVNLISAVGGAISVANLFLLLRLWLKAPLPALIGALSYGLSWTIWQHACIAEVYTLYCATFLLELVFLYLYIEKRKPVWLYLLAFMNGVSLANHMWAVIALFVYCWFLVWLIVRKQVKIGHIIGLMLVWIIGDSPYLFLIVRRFIQTGDLAATLLSAAFGDGWQNSVMNSSISMRIVIENMSFLFYNFATYNFVLLVAGIIVLIKKVKYSTWNILVLLLTGIYYLFAFRYTVPDRYAFFIPFYCLAGVIIGAGANYFLQLVAYQWCRFIILVGCFVPLVVYATVPAMAEKMQINMGVKRSIPYRNDYQYFLQPWQTGNNGPRRFAEEVLREVDKNAIIYADNTTVYALWNIHAIKGMRPDVTIYSSSAFNENSPFENPHQFSAVLMVKPAYVISNVKGYCPEFIITDYDIVYYGKIWRIQRKEY